jgi:peptidoglycan hydrolase-like protein with peptidoglycan-binding domain
MRSVFGVLLILVGLSVAAHALIGWETETVAGGDEQALSFQTVANSTTVAKSASPPATGPIPMEPPRATAQTEPEARVPRHATAPRQRLKPRVVTIGANSRTPVGRTGAPDAAPPDRAALTREMQRELRRVGCYDGGVTGVWSPSTRRAMKQFTERTNSVLPVDQPDQILLAMLLNHDDSACGANAVIAGTAKPGTFRPASGAAPDAATAASTGTEPIPGRMALAGPKVEEERAAAARAVRPEKRARASRPRESRPFGPWIFRERMGW